MIEIDPDGQLKIYPISESDTDERTILDRLRLFADTERKGA